MICARCGYDRRNVHARDPYLPCPECGDDGCAGVIKPWPSPAKVVWRLLRWPLFSASVMLPVLILSMTTGVMPCVGGTLVFVILVVFVGAPFAAAGEMVQLHCPENRRMAVSCGLVALGWGSGLVLLAALVAVCGWATSLLL